MSRRLFRDPDSDPQASDDAAGKLRHRAAAAGLAGLLVAGVALWVWLQGAERRAVLELPPAERQALFERTRATLESVCRGPRTALAGYCREQAELIPVFPECDAACESLARGILAQPPR
jgi:hypothetical protein